MFIRALSPTGIQFAIPMQGLTVANPLSAPGFQHSPQGSPGAPGVPRTRAPLRSFQKVRLRRTFWNDLRTEWAFRESNNVGLRDEVAEYHAVTLDDGGQSVAAVDVADLASDESKWGALLAKLNGDTGSRSMGNQEPTHQCVQGGAHEQ